MSYQLLERIAQGFGKGEPATLRVRVFRLVTAQTAGLCFFVMTPTNLAQHTSLAVHLATIMLGATSAFFFWLSCRGRSHPAVFLVTALLIFDFIWFLSAGSRGSVTYFYLPALLFTFGAFPVRAGWLFALAQVVHVPLLFALEHYFPFLVTPYQSEADRIVDHITGIVVAGVTTVVIAAILLRDYNREHRRLLELADQLAVSEQRYRVIFNATSDAMFIHGADGRLLDLNERACTLFGFDRATGLQLTINDCSLGVSPYSEIDAREKIALAFQGAPQVFEWRSRRHQGELFWSEVALRAGDFAGERCVIASLRDISVRKKAQQELRDNEERLRLALQVTHQGWFELNVQTGHGVVSPEYIRILGFESDAFTTTISNWLESIHPDDRENVGREFHACVAAGDTRTMEYRRRTQNGGWKWIRSIGKITEWDADGRPLKMAGTHADITERKELERQLLHSQRLETVGTLASGVAHDLNNILTPMLMASGLLRDSLPNPADREMMAKIEQGGRRGAAIVRQLLDFSRNMSVERITLNPCELARGVAAKIRAVFPKEISIVESIPDSPLQIEGDSVQLHQMLLSLCNNARDAMPQGGTLTLGLESTMLTSQTSEGSARARSGSFAVFTVSDTGHGIPVAIREKIFDPFFTTKETGKGTGLGLASAHGVVTAHRGFIRFESTVNLGATFRVFLPVKPAVAENSIAAPLQAAATAPMPATTGCILVVDDEPMIVATTARYLQKCGYEALSASGGTEALSILRTRQKDIQLVITDFKMPGMDGPTLLPLLRQIVPGIKVIGVSGLDQHDNGIALGFDAIMSKPYEWTTLLPTIRRVIERT